MLTARHRLYVALAAALLLAPAALARKAQAQAQAAPEQQDNYVTSKMFQNRVFEIKNRDPLSLARVLSSLTSGFRGAIVSPNPEFRTITVRDFPENIAAIEDAIRRLDTPEASRPSVEFQVHMLLASNDPAVLNNFPSDLGGIVKQLQSSLGYKNFGLMGSQVVRSKEGRVDTNNRGVADLRLVGEGQPARNNAFYSYNIRGVSIDPQGTQVQIEEFTMDMRVPITLSTGQPTYENVGFKNPVSLRDGDRVVAGTTSIADKSVVVVISAKTMK
jgi:type II secretory pathway component GspD/PulD (secretin)